MKIAFITVHRVKNYGSALLCYATQCIFEKHGFIVEFIDYARMQSNEVDSLWDFFFSKMKEYRGRKIRGVVQFIIELPAGLRIIKSFRSFREKYLKLSDICYKDNEQMLKKRPPIADIYCTGGDQMWNEQYNFNRTLEPFYLNFGHPEIPKISFSTSIGKEKFDDWEIPEVVPLLKRYKYLSVREESALNTLKALGFDNVTHIQDPTFLIESIVWDNMASQRLVKEPYILFYGIKSNKTLEKRIQDYANKTNRKLYYIKNYSNKILPEPKNVFILPDPEEFISLIKYADYVVTDSFHGTVFSIKLKKKFLSVLANHSTRLESLLSICNLKERKYTEDDEIANQIEKFIDYEMVERIWLKEREKADAWIESIKTIN